jgi:hypothetical protein
VVADNAAAELGQAVNPRDHQMSGQVRVSPLVEKLYSIPTRLGRLRV